MKWEYHHDVTKPSSSWSHHFRSSAKILSKKPTYSLGPESYCFTSMWREDFSLIMKCTSSSPGQHHQPTLSKEDPGFYVPTIAANLFGTGLGWPLPRQSFKKVKRVPWLACRRWSFDFTDAFIEPGRHLYLYCFTVDVRSMKKVTALTVPG